MAGDVGRRQLALLGGEPLFSDVLHVGRPNVGDRTAFMHRMEEIFDGGWLTNDGPFVKELEAEIRQMTGVRHCIAMCNGTVALEIAIRAMGLKGEVIVPAFTFVATAHALQWQEITPVFCDVEPDTHAIDVDRIPSLVTPRTTGILGVHLWGNVCDAEAIDRVARDNGLQSLYDAAHAFGCSRGDIPVGHNGRAEVLSFHATKFLNAFEGGAVLTNDDELADRIKLMRNFGFAGYDNVIYVGTNGKMTEVSAAMGLTNLADVDSFVSANRSNYEAYDQCLSAINGLQVFRPGVEQDAWNYQYVVALIDGAVSALSRDELLKVLWAENVHARRYFAPGVHRMEPYRSYFPHAGLLLPVTERLSETVLVLPTGTAISPDVARSVCGVISDAVEHATDVKGACAAAS